MRENFREIERSCPTIFIDNLHHEMSKKELYEIIKGRQKIIDIFISRKRRVNTKFHFGFIRVETNEELEALVRRCNGLVHRGIKLFLKPARFGPPSVRKVSREDARKTQVAKSSYVPQNVGVSRFPSGDQRTFKEVVQNQQGHSQKGYYSNGSKLDQKVNWKKKQSISVQPCEENLQWLKKSIVVSCTKPMKKKEVIEMLQKLQIQQCCVTDMGPWKFLITFSSEDQIANFVESKMEKLMKCFADVKLWSSPEKCKVRRVWLEILGIPLHLWSEENIIKIAHNWGDVIEIEEGTRKKQSFARALVLIDTSYMDRIEESRLIQSQEEGFDVLIKEIAMMEPSHEAGDHPKELTKILTKNVEDGWSQLQMGSLEEDVVPETVMSEGISQEKLEQLPNNDINERKTREKAADTINSSHTLVNSSPTHGNNRSIEDDGPMGSRRQILGDGLNQKGQNTASEASDKESGANLLNYEVSNVSVSDNSIPPGFDQFTSQESIIKAKERKRQAARTMKKFLRRKRPDLLVNETRRRSKKKHLTVSLDPNEILHFFSLLGLEIEGNEDSIRANIESMLMEEKARWFQDNQ